VAGRQALPEALKSLAAGAAAVLAQDIIKKDIRITVVGRRHDSDREVWPDEFYADEPLRAPTCLLVAEATCNPSRQCLCYKLCQLERFLTALIKAASAAGGPDKDVLRVVVAAAIATQRADGQVAATLTKFIFQNNQALPLLYRLCMANSLLLVSIEGEACSRLLQGAAREGGYVVPSTAAKLQCQCMSGIPKATQIFVSKYISVLVALNLVTPGCCAVVILSADTATHVDYVEGLASKLQESNRLLEIKAEDADMYRWVAVEHGLHGIDGLHLLHDDDGV
jgi:hypothetical protein